MTDGPNLDVEPQGADGRVRRVLQRVVAPLDSYRSDARALYVNGLAVDLDRYRMLVPQHTTTSFGTYFNAFPAAYWRRWTDIDDVRLHLRLTGAGKVTVIRSTSKGMSWPERSVVVEGDGPHEIDVDLPLEPFIDGGWYWFEITAFSAADVIIEAGDWSTTTDDLTAGRLSVGITTYNRPAYCVDQIRNLGGYEQLVDILDAVYVIDQGTDRLEDHPDFAAAATSLGDKLHVLTQGNLGGSGGFARAMSETLRAGTSDYVLLLDDDVITEPEGVLRAVTFADLARQPVLVGGHMFSIFARSVLHAWGEAIDKYPWMWGPAPHTYHSHDFAATPLRDVAWLHRRIDVDYNGWWMCLIPTAVLQKVGLAMPMFIKWDDADFGLRAEEHGFPTVSLPGAAVWHVPWHEKDDTVDWQAYFHARNRLLSALLHSPYQRGGRLPRESFEVVLKHALAMQYSPAEMILMAIEDLLEGPEHLHRDIGSKVTELRAIRARFDDSRFAEDLNAYPPVKIRKPPRRGVLPPAPTSKAAATALAFKLLPRHLRPLNDFAQNHPQVALPHADQQWWRLAQYDSVLVSSADGSGAAWYRRDPDRFRSLLRRSTVLHSRLLREWGRLSVTYCNAVPELASMERWASTFAQADADAAPATDLPKDSRSAGPNLST